MITGIYKLKHSLHEKFTRGWKITYGNTCWMLNSTEICFAAILHKQQMSASGLQNMWATTVQYYWYGTIRNYVGTTNQSMFAMCALLHMILYAAALQHWDLHSWSFPLVKTASPAWSWHSTCHQVGKSKTGGCQLQPGFAEHLQNSWWLNLVIKTLNMCWCLLVVVLLVLDFNENNDDV